MTTERIQTLERQFEILRYPFVRGPGLLEPVGFVPDLISEIEDETTAERAKLDTLPIPHPDNREGYCRGSDLRYWLFGLEDFDKALTAAGRLGRDRGSVFDFGGSTGRVFRHFIFQTRAFEIWTSDFNATSFAWNQRYAPSRVRTFLNGFYPALPLEDRMFDVVLAFSVFTHIDQFETAWLLELRRILKPGGLLYVTIHDEEFWNEMPETVWKAVRMSSNGAHLEDDAQFPDEREAYHFTLEGYYSCNVFHSKHYIRQQWGRFFEIVDIMPRGHQKQCVVLLTR